MMTLMIDGRKVEAEDGTTILDAALKAKIHIPTLCYLPEVQAIGACRVCLVEVEGNKVLQASCIAPASDGMVVYTNTERVRKARKFSVEMLLSNHPFECLTCAKNLHCELQNLASELQIREVRLAGEKSEGRIDESSPSIRRDQNKCILCRRCVTVCQEIQSVTALYTVGRGFEARVEPAFGRDINDVACTNCGQCSMVCPVGAITEKEYIDEIFEAINDLRNSLLPRMPLLCELHWAKNSVIRPEHW